MSSKKTITIDQLKPGMFIVGMDQPWYRTPFLFHSRLIRHKNDIALLRQHGIREVTIDPGKGLDLEPDQPPDAPPSDQTDQAAEDDRTRDKEAVPSGPQEQAAPSDSVAAGQNSSDERLTAEKQPGAPANQPHMNTEIEALQPDLPNSSAAEPEAAGSKPASPQQTDQATAGTAARPAPPADEETSAIATARKQAAAAQAAYRDATISMKRLFEELEAGIVPQPEALRHVVWSVLSRVLEDSNSMLSLLYLQKMQRFDRTLASHALDVCTLSLIVAHAYGVPEQEMDELGAGALLHDIGYIRLPRNLYRKNHELTDQENAVMQQHPALGVAILREANEHRNLVIRIVGEHQECRDGSGFPQKLRGDDLSHLAQLVGLADIYDGMISRRGGKPAMLPHDAIRQLFRLGDTGQFAKDLIEATIRGLGVYPIGSLALLNTGEQAVVVAVNPAQRLKPVIKVITGPQGGSYLTPIRVDLASQATDATQRAIAKVLDPLQERVNVALFLDGVEPEAA